MILPITANRILWFLGALLFAIVLWLTTPRGLGLSPDSVAYLKAVQGLISDQGFSYFSVQWPPLFSVAIYLTSQLTKLDYVQGARLLSALLYGCTFLLTGRLLSSLISGDYRWIASYVFAGLLCLHPVITHVYFYAFSETLFLPFVLLNLIVLFSCCRIGVSATGSLYLSLIALGATSTRYAGLALVALNIVMLWRWANQDTIGKKISRSLVHVAPNVILLLWWRQHLGVGDTDTNQRPLVWHPITLENIHDGLLNLGTWVIPISHQTLNATAATIFTATGGVLAFGLSVRAIKGFFTPATRTLTDPSGFSRRCLITLIGLFTLGYLLFLVCIRSLFDPNIVFDHRMLSPIFLPITCVLVSAYTNIQRQSLQLLMGGILCTIFVLPLQQLRPWLLISYFNGIELNDKSRLSSSIMRFIRTCPKTAQIFADQPWDFNLEFHSMVHWLPTPALYGSGLVDSRYHTKIANLPRIAELIVIENRQSGKVETIEDLGAFTIIYKANDGVVWQHKSLPSNYCSQTTNIFYN